METILRNENAKHKTLHKFSYLLNYSEISARQDDTEKSTGLTVNMNFTSSSAESCVNLSSAT